MDAESTLGQVIRTRRLALGLTQEELAERIGDGVRQAEVSRLECDRVTLPRRRRMERIAAALDLPLGQLLATAGWSGADGAFRPGPPAASQAGTSFGPASTDPDASSGQYATPAMTDLRHALVRAQELHWRTLQLLDTSRDLAARWDAGRPTRLRSQSARTSG
jgi:transcriptional regulator with XRE-family HTH domain